MAKKKTRRVSIKTVAEECGVAPSTVSYALNNSRYVTPETKRRILESAERLGYRASAVARGLRMQRSWSVGLLLTSISNPFYPEVARGVEDVVNQNECNLILCNTDYQEDKQDRYVRVLIDRQVDGIILGSHPTEKHLNDLKQAHIPFVLLNKGIGVLKGDCVAIDNQGGIATAVDHLVALGHRRIGFIRGHAMSGATPEREKSFIDSVKRHGLRFDKELVVPGHYDYVSGQIGCQRLLNLTPRPTAIVAASDLMALGAIEAIRSAGMNVPVDISVVGFDDIFISGLPEIQLTTIGVAKRELGAAAARLLLERMDGQGQPDPCEIVFPTRLIERKTTAMAKPAPKKAGGKA
jgi:DNA-binding LacI/PurR family transcriptional regulator